MITGIVFYTIYMLAAACTAVVSQTVFEALLIAHPRLRDCNFGWIAWPLGILSGITWPITVPVALIIAGVIK